MNDENVTAELEGDTVWLWSGFRHKEMIKLISGARWDKNRSQWRLPISWGACLRLRGVLGDQLLVGPNLAAWALNDMETRVNPAMALREAMELKDGFKYDERLLQFQDPGVAFLITAAQCILADEMGTGKTVQVAVALRILAMYGRNPFPCLIVAPKSVKKNWRRELAKFCPDATVSVPKSGVVNLRKALAENPDVVIINYENTWRFSRLAGYGNMALTDVEKTPKELNNVEWRTFIADEAHRIKEPKAKQTRACWWLAHQKTVEFRFLLTGTPIANAPDDLWSQLHLIAPEEYPSKSGYVDRYCLQSWNGWGGMQVIGIRPEMKDEFFRILHPRMRRMPKDLVLPFLPSKIRVVRECEMNTKQRKAYEAMRDTMLAEIGGEGEDYTVATLPIVKRTRLMQFSSSFAELNEDGEVRLSEPSSKIDEFMDYLDELGDECCVVYAQSRQLIMLAAARLEKAKIPHSMIVGGMTEDEREKSMDDFMSGRVRVFLGTIMAAGEGITLTRARHIAFLQRADSMLGNLQAEDRVHRIGSEIHDHIHVTDFVAPGTVEEEQIDNLLAKQGRLQEIVQDRARLRKAADEGNQDAINKLAELEAEQQLIMGGTL